MSSPSFLSSYLNSGLAEIEPESQVFPGKDVRVGRALEGPLQFIQLEGRERRPIEVNAQNIVNVAAVDNFSDIHCHPYRYPRILSGFQCVGTFAAGLKNCALL